MRFMPAAFAAAAILMTVSSASISAPSRPRPISELSLAMQAEGARLQAAGDLDAAVGYYETALVADPRNADALIALGHVARSQNLPGKAIGRYREALALRPDDRAALAGQGGAYVERGAFDRARRNLAQLQALCGDQECVEVAALTIAINSAGQRTALNPEQVMPQPVIEAAPVND